MKTFKLFGLLLAFFSVSFISCQKNAQTMSGDATDDLQTCAGYGGGGFSSGGGTGSTGGSGSSTNSGGGSTGSATGNEQNIIPGNISFCNPKTVSLCTQQGNVGSVTVRRGFDDKIYVTYSLAANYFLADVRVYTGSAAGITMTNNRVNICDFPFRKTMSMPYNVNEYTFVLRNEPSSFTVAAYAAVVKVVNNVVRQVAEAWGDACNGQVISSGGSTSSFENFNLLDCKGANWATRFDYVSGPCVAAAPASEPEGICSKAIPVYFGINPLYNAVTAWPVDNVTVGGHTYTEAEGRDIANTTDVNGVCADSKYAFLRVATLKLSGTNWEASPTLNVQVTTIENYLATCGKISPAHLPTGNAAVRSAAAIVNTWIDEHICPDRR